jgi:hypothetical protein
MFCKHASKSMNHLYCFYNIFTYLIRNYQSLLTSVNFTNILSAAFAPKTFCQKITNPNCKHIKAGKNLLYEKSARKILVKLTSFYLCL